MSNKLTKLSEKSQLFFNTICKRLSEGDVELQKVFAKARLLRMFFDWDERNKICIGSKKALVEYVFDLEPIVDEQSYDLTLQWVKAHDVDGELANKPVGSSIFKEEKLQKLLGFFLLNLQRNPLNYMQLLTDCDFIDECNEKLLSPTDDRLPF